MIVLLRDYCHLLIKIIRMANISFGLIWPLVIAPKDCNPPNVPQLRPIEDFWGILKGLVYENDWSTDSIENLKLRIKKKLKEMNPNFYQCLTKKLLTKIRIAADYSAHSFIH
jgi:hypothetical protein